MLLSLIAVAASIPLLAIGLGLSRASIPASVLRFVPGWSFIRIDVAAADDDGTARHPWR